MLHCMHVEDALDPVCLYLVHIDNPQCKTKRNGVTTGAAVACRSTQPKQTEYHGLRPRTSCPCTLHRRPYCYQQTLTNCIQCAAAMVSSLAQRLSSIGTVYITPRQTLCLSIHSTVRYYTERAPLSLSLLRLITAPFATPYRFGLALAFFFLARAAAVRNHCQPKGETSRPGRRAHSCGEESAMPRMSPPRFLCTW